MSFLDGPTPIAFAHRGFDLFGAENSMVAFQGAIDLGYRYLETDVRVTADGVALAFHDARLDRVTDRRGVVARLPWAQVRHARIGGREPIPLLADVLATWPDACVNLDVKADHSLAATLDAIRASGAIDRVCVGAFSDARVAAVRRAFGSRLCTALGPREAVALRLTSRVGRRPRAGAGLCAQVPARLGGLVFTDRRLVTTAHEMGLQVHAWTVNDADEMARLLDLDVDGLMTDRADVLRDVLLRRGKWWT